MKKHQTVLYFVLLSHLTWGCLQDKTLKKESSEIKQDSIGTLTKATTRSFELPQFKPEVRIPQMELLKQYGDYPVDLAHGLTDISIPIYEVRTKNLSLPVSINFHASGLKADETESSLGMRWVLNTGGMVSRKIKGYPDESFNFKQEINPSFNPDFITLYGTTWNEAIGTNHNFIRRLDFLRDVDYSYSFKSGEYRDTEYDIFSFMLPNGESGKFILKDHNGIKTAVFMPYEPFKVNIDENSNHIEIIDDTGTLFQYGSYVEEDQNMNRIGWYLTAIKSADRQETITLEYQRFYRQSVAKWYDYADVSDNLDNSIPEFDGEFIREGLQEYFAKHSPYEEFSNVWDYIAPNCISKITFPLGELNFQYTNGLLNTITLRDNATGTNLQRFKFYISKGLNNVMNLLKSLTKVSLTNNTEKIEEVHRFEYYDSASLPNYDNLSKYADWWGFYTSRGGRKIITEEVIINSPNHPHLLRKTIGGYADRNSIADDMKLGMIKSIQYPTGGKTEFEYEANRYAYYQNRQSDCGGLRIKQINNFLGDGNVETKTFDYGENGCGTIPDYLFHTGLDNNYIETCTEINAFDQLKTSEGIYLAEIIQACGTYRTRIYNGEFPNRYFDYHSNIVYYDRVTEYYGTKAQNSGKTEYHFHNKILDIGDYVYDRNYSFIQPTEIYISPTDFWYTNKLTSKKVYENLNGNYILRKENDYTYEKIQKEEVYDLPVLRFKNYLSLPSNWPDDDSAEGKMNCYELKRTFMDLDKTFGYKVQKHTIGASKLTKEIERTYTDDGVVSTQREIKHDSMYLFPIEEKLINSDGKINTVRYTYPFNYSQSTYNEMVERNILSPVIEKSAFSHDGLLLQKEIFNYGRVFTDFYAPVSFQYQSENNPIETRLLYNYYEKGSIVEILKDNEERFIYLFGYKGHYPIAEIQNATYNNLQSAANSIGLNLNTLNSLLVPDMNKINLLKEQAPLKRSLITTYSYKPLLGVIEHVLPNNIRTNYTINNIGRLIEVYFGTGSNKRILEHYKYHNKN